jgi:hypothetical protein
MKNEALRESLVQQAEAAFLQLSSQIDFLFNAVSFYLDKYPINGSEKLYKNDKEIKFAVDQIAEHFSALGERIKCWKLARSTPQPPIQFEIDTLNELWSNISVLLFFLVKQGIDPSPFRLKQASWAFQTIVTCNRLLP